MIVYVLKREGALYCDKLIESTATGFIIAYASSLRQ